MKNKLTQLLAICFCLVSCSEISSGEKENVSKAILDIQSDLNTLKYDYIFLIPNAGCPGCTTSAENFLLRNLDEKSILYIMTSFNSVKEIRIKLGNDVLELGNLILDDSDNFFKNHVITAYPIIYHLREGVISKVDTVSPKYPNSIADLESLIINSY